MMIVNAVADIDGALSSFKFSGNHVRIMTRAAVLDATNKGYRIAFGMAPVDTGAYRSSFDTQFSSSPGKFYGEFGTDDDKGFALELGGQSGSMSTPHPGKDHFRTAAYVAEKYFHTLMEDVANNA